MPRHQLTLCAQITEFLLYTAPNGVIKVEVLLADESIWLTQTGMAELFGVGVPAVSKHLKNIFESNELDPGFSYFHFGNNCRMAVTLARTISANRWSGCACSLAPASRAVSSCRI